MVTVVGLGFVGLTTALGFAEYGHKVYGIEANSERLDVIKGGKLPFLEPNLDEALIRHLNNNFIPTSDWELAISNSEYIYFCVGTPYGKDGQADLSFLFTAIDQTLKAISDDKFRVFVTKSTIPPSTSKDRIIAYLEKKGIKVPEQIGVANNPEFLREGHCWDDFINADRIVLGVSDKKSEEMLRELYKPSMAPVYSVSLNTGEFIKYLSNTSLACLISFANEMSIAADTIGDINVAEAFRILHMDKRWQTGSIRTYFYPGCGYGGYCLPKDTNAFYALAKSAGFAGPILKSVIDTNDHMPEVVAMRIIKATGGDISSKIGILGLSFNPGSDDVRDTPSAKIIRELIGAGYRNIIAYDPIATGKFKQYYSDLNISYADSLQSEVDVADVLAIVTAWEDFRNIRQMTNKKVVDCRFML